MRPLRQLLAAAVAIALLFNPETGMSSETARDETLVNAVKDNDAEKVRALLAAYRQDGLDLPVHKHYGTLLHIAASYGSERVATVLLESGLSAQATTSYGATPLHFATRDNKPGMVTLLLAAGADVNARTARGLTPLHVSDGPTQILLDAGADPNALDEEGQTALFNAGPDVSALVKAGLDVNARNRHGWTPLHVAALHGSTDHARALLDHGAEIETKTPAVYVIRTKESWGTEERSIPAGYTALDIAHNEHDRVKWVTGRNRPMIELLRSRGATKPFLGLRFLRW